MGTTDGSGGGAGLTMEDRVKAWELRLKILGFIGAMSAGLFGFVKYLDQREKEFKQASERQVEQWKAEEQRHKEEVAAADKAYKLHLYQERRALYAEACAAAATIAAESPEKAGESVKEFWKLYYGELCLVEDDEVAKAMQVFAQHLQAPEGDRDLRLKALELSTACRKSLNLKELYGVPEVTLTKPVVEKRWK